MKSLFALMTSMMVSFGLMAQDLSKDQRVLVDKHIEQVKKWAADPEIVAAVKEANKSGPLAGMDQDKWSKAPVLDPAVRGFTKNKAAETLKKQKAEYVSEMFLNASEGYKVAFLSKTSNWSHKTSAKHSDPMAGKVWVGKIEVDESSGTQQVQVGVPVMDGDKAIGSLVVGFALAKLK